MKKLLFILLCAVGLSVNAIDYTPFSASAPAVSMQSVNNADYMASGSAYSSSVSEVGSYSPSDAAPNPAARRAGGPGGTGGSSSYDPNNPQFAPLGNALVPLLILAFI